MALKTAAASTLFFLHFATIIIADFHVFVRVYSFAHPTRKCPVCRINNLLPVGCCDKFEEVNKCTDNNYCEYFFNICLRRFGTFPNTVATRINSNCIPTLTSQPNTTAAQLDFSRSSFSGLPNPVWFRNRRGGWKGAQVYLQIYDYDFNQNPNDLIDSFSIDVEQIPIGVETTPQVYNGTFGFAFIELSVRIECIVSHYYPNCDTSCVLRGNCTCLPGYTGAACEVIFDPCAEATCPNNSICRSQTGNNSHTCECLPGFIGNDCVKDVCFGVNCSGRGQCETGVVEEFICNCSLGYTGAQCEERKDYCLGVSCNGRGTCVNELGRFMCRCRRGYNGTLCEQSECTGVNCSGHGECRVMAGGGYNCVCDTGYTGTQCETQIDCMSANCSSRQQCLNGFRCVCRPEYTGELCETLVGCIDVYCNENGVCTMKGDGSFSCDCYVGFTGEFCDLSIEKNSTISNETVLDINPVPMGIGLGVGGGVILVFITALVVLLPIAIITRHNKKNDHYDYIDPGLNVVHNNRQHGDPLAAQLRVDPPLSPLLQGAPKLPPRPHSLSSPLQHNINRPLSYLEAVMASQGHGSSLKNDIDEPLSSLELMAPSRRAGSSEDAVAGGEKEAQRPLHTDIATRTSSIDNPVYDIEL